MVDETELLDISNLSDQDWDALEAMRAGDHLVRRDGHLALMDEATFNEAYIGAIKTATAAALRSLNALMERADIRPLPSPQPSDSITVVVTLEDGRTATASASLWPSVVVH